MTMQPDHEGEIGKENQISRQRLGRYKSDGPQEVKAAQILRPLVVNRTIYNSAKLRYAVKLKSNDAPVWRKAKGKELPGYATNSEAIQPDSDYYFLMPQYAGAANDAGARQHIIATANGFFDSCGVLLHTIDRVIPKSSNPEYHSLVFVLPAAMIENEAALATIREQYQPLYEAALDFVTSRGTAR
jgi:hypothetical protein